MRRSSEISRICLQPDWVAAETETVELLKTLIGFNTTNPPGHELPLGESIATRFRNEGIDTELLIPVPDRAIVVARLRGSGVKRPVMLLSHMDVVGVDAGQWTSDPFEGVVRDGYLYGRGAIDDKGMLAVNVMTMLLLKRGMMDRGLQLDRDVVFVATSDEETGGRDGMQWLVENRPDCLDAEFAVNEGGRTRIIQNNRRYLAVQTAEKIPHSVTVTARGPAGHAAIPLAANAIFGLGRALERLSRYREPVTLIPTTRRFFGELAPIWPDAVQGGAMSDLVSDDAARSAAGAEVLAAVPVLNAVMRNGISPTRLSGGIAGNVIPAEATAVLNVRTIPGQKIEDVVARLRGCIGDEAIEVAITSHGDEAPASDADSAMFNAISRAANALDPDMAVVPYLSTGGTDSAHLRRIGIDSYGILPFPMVQSDEERMHGHDERVPVKSLHFGTRLIYGSIVEIAVNKR